MNRATALAFGFALRTLSFSQSFHSSNKFHPNKVGDQHFKIDLINIFFAPYTKTRITIAYKVFSGNVFAALLDRENAPYKKEANHGRRKFSTRTSCPGRNYRAQHQNLP